MRNVSMVLVALAMRRPVVVAIAVTLIAMGIGLAASVPWLNKGGGDSREEPAFTVDEATTSKQPTVSDAVPIADFVLSDQDGRRVSLRQHGGKVLLVNFITSRCTAACVQVTRELQGLQKALGARMGREVVFFSIALDPRVDSPEAVRAFARDHGVDFSGWNFLTGTAEQLDRARRAFGAVMIDLPEGQDTTLSVEHTASTYLVDRHGILREKLAPAVLTMIGLHEIETVLAESTTM